MAPSGQQRRTGHPTRLQRQFERGWLVLPDTRPAGLSERAWTVLVRHIRERVPYAALSAELGLSAHRAHQIATRAAAALRYPELAELPAALRHALVVGGYTTRAAVARASDEDVLRLKGISAATLRELRRLIPRVQ